jgi:hypothetical protein
MARTFYSLGEMLTAIKDRLAKVDEAGKVVDEVALDALMALDGVRLTTDERNTLRSKLERVRSAAHSMRFATSSLDN